MANFEIKVLGIEDTNTKTIFEICIEKTDIILNSCNI